MTLFEEMMESTWFAITTLVASSGVGYLWYFSILPRPLYGTGSGWYLPPFLIGIEVVGVALLALRARPNSAERNPLANERAGTLVRVEETSLATHKRAGVC